MTWEAGRRGLRLRYRPRPMFDQAEKLEEQLAAQWSAWSRSGVRVTRPSRLDGGRR
jgi:hypothetical protein